MGRRILALRFEASGALPRGEGNLRWGTFPKTRSSTVLPWFRHDVGAEDFEDSLSGLVLGLMGVETSP